MYDNIAHVSDDELAAHWQITFVPPGIFRCVRQARQYASATEAESVLATMNARLPVVRHTLGIMLDARFTPAPTQDPNIDAIIIRYRKKLFEGFAAAAILVKTAAGTMQVWKQAKQDGVVYRVFNREDAVMEYLCRALEPGFVHD